MLVEENTNQQQKGKYQWSAFVPRTGRVNPTIRGGLLKPALNKNRVFIAFLSSAGPKFGSENAFFWPF